MNLPSRIFLVGMPGSGKSTVGKFLASETGYSFIDLDDRIEAEVGSTISAIFEEKGEAYFRKVEQKELHRISEQNAIVSTGGGAPCFFDNMDWMNNHGFTIYLNRDLQTILERTDGKDHRPLLAVDREQTLRELMVKRLPFYQKAGMESSQSDSIEILTELQRRFKN